MRFAKLVVLLLIAAGFGFLVGLLRPRRVTSRSDIASSMNLHSGPGGDGGDESSS